MCVAETETGRIVAAYDFGGVTVRIGDAGFAKKSKEQIERDRRAAQIIACQIVRRAMERGCSDAGAR